MRQAFPETSWTLLAQARQKCAEGDRARADFIDRYYRPVREFLLVLLQDPEVAQDLAHEFFARLSGEGTIIDLVRPEKGAFRNYLKETLRNLAIDYHRRQRREVLRARPDPDGEWGWEVLQQSVHAGAEAAFHRAWVQGILAEALGRVRALCAKRGQTVHLDLFEQWYVNDMSDEEGRAISWNVLGARYGLDGKAARERADTVVRHFRMTLRRMLRNDITVSGSGQITEGAIDQEVRTLLSPLED